MKLLGNKFLLLSALIGASLAVYLLSVYYNRSFPIEVVTAPEQINLFINNSPSTYPGLSLKRGTYQVKAEKPGFRAQEFEFSVPNELTLAITLTPEPELSYNTRPFLTHSLTPTSLGLLGVDKTTGNLINYSGAQPVIIYSGSVKSWSYNYPWIALIDNAKSKIFVLVNLLSKESLDISSPVNSDVVWASVSSDGTTAYILTSLDAIKRETVAYIYQINSKTYSKLGSGGYTQVEPLVNNTLLLTSEADGEYLTKCQLIESSQYIKIKEWSANRCPINETRSAILIEAPEIIIFDILSRSEFNTKSQGGVAWSGNRPLVVKRTNSGVVVDIYDGTSLSKSQTLPLNNYLRVIGANASHVTLQNIDGQIISYALE